MDMTRLSQRPYWMEIPEAAGGTGGQDDPWMKVAKAVVGTILMLVLAMALCSLLPGCRSTKIDREDTIHTETESHSKEQSGDSLAFNITQTTIEGILEDVDKWWNIEYEKTIWSEPDSNGVQYKISTETLVGSGGSHKTRQDTISSSTAADLHAGSSLAKVEDNKDRYDENIREKKTVTQQTWWWKGIKWGGFVIAAVIIVGILWRRGFGLKKVFLHIVKVIKAK